MQATAKVFAQASAKDVVLVGRRLEVLEDVKASLKNKHPTCNALAEKCDVSDEDEVDQLFQRLQDRNIEIDVLINNAGVNLDRAPIKESNVKNWWRNYVSLLQCLQSTNLDFQSSRLCLPNSAY